MCENKNCRCNDPCKPVICVSYQEDSCADRKLTTSNTEHPTGYNNVTIITPEVNQISAYKDHLEFVNSPEPLSGIKGHSVLRLTQSFINSILNIFKGRNVGTGEGKVYKGAATVGSDTFQDFKSIKSSESVDIDNDTDEITVSVNSEWLQDQIPEIDYPVIDGESIGDGVSIYGGLVGKKIQQKSIIAGDGIRITTTANDITISTPQSGSSGDTDWYLDSSYIRPTDGSWTPSEIIDGMPLPKGTLSDPFKTYEEFLKKYIGSSTGSNANGPYSKVNPRGGSIILQIISHIATSADLEVNNAQLKLKGGAILNYTGGRTYALDFQELWNLMPRTGGIIDRSITMILSGEGTFTRTDYQGSPRFGMIRIKMNETETNSTRRAGFGFSPEGTGLEILESENLGSSMYQPLTREDGTTPLFNGNNPILGANQAPVTPLIYIDGKTFQYWSAYINGTKLKLKTKTQKGIHCVNKGSITGSNDRMLYQVENSRIGYQKKMWRVETSPGSGVYNYFPSGLTTEEREIVDGRANSSNPSGLFFKPYEEYSMFTAEGESNIRLENIGTEPNGFICAGADSIILLKSGVFLFCITFHRIHHLLNFWWNISRINHIFNIIN